MIRMKFPLFLVLVLLLETASSEVDDGTCPSRRSPVVSGGKKVDLNTLEYDHALVDATTPEVIRHYGYPAETHYVTTSDGYILEMHRVPFGKDGMDPGKPRKPVLVQHGLLCSSFDWVINPPGEAIAYSLVDAGYDVWLGNFRGNTYAKKHTKLKPSSEEFWDFSWDEMGKHDLPAMIDYILARTGYPKIHYVGHSMGTTTFFVMMDSHPEYNEKVEELFGLGTVATVDHMKSPLRYLSSVFEPVSWALGLFGVDQFLPSSKIMTLFSDVFCEDDDFTQFLCTNFIFVICGYSPHQMNETMLPIYISGTPAGTSMKTVVHYMQGVDSAKFQNYDYPFRKNQEVYGQSEPPEYDLKKTTVPTYMYWGPNDWLATPEDTMELADWLPNVKLLKKVEDKKFNHIDFMWGVTANELVYKSVVEEMLRIDKH